MRYLPITISGHPNPTSLYNSHPYSVQFIHQFSLPAIQLSIRLLPVTVSITCLWLCLHCHVYDHYTIQRYVPASCYAQLHEDRLNGQNNDCGLAFFRVAFFHSVNVIETREELFIDAKCN